MEQGDLPATAKQAAEIAHLKGYAWADYSLAMPVG